MRLSSLPLAFLVVFFPAIAFASASVLVSDEMRNFPHLAEEQGMQAFIAEGKGPMLHMRYSSDKPLTLEVAFPFRGNEERVSYNPLHVLTIKELRAGEGEEIELDLTDSPAWSPLQERFLVRVLGPNGATVKIHDIDIEGSSVAAIFPALWKGLSVGEAMLLSNINYLWGYRALGVNVSVYLGILFILSIALLLVRSTKSQISNIKWLLSLSLLFLLLYNLRFSSDLLAISAADLSGWRENHEYRQLGPTHKIIDRLREELRTFKGIPEVAVCLSLDDIYFKQIRYHLYPIPVVRAEDPLEHATHFVLLGTEGIGDTENGIACEEGQKLRPATLLEDFGEGSAVYRFDTSSLP